MRGRHTFILARHLLKPILFAELVRCGSTSTNAMREEE